MNTGCQTSRHLVTSTLTNHHITCKIRPFICQLILFKSFCCFNKSRSQSIQYDGMKLFGFFERVICLGGGKGVGLVHNLRFFGLKGLWTMPETRRMHKEKDRERRM